MNTNLLNNKYSRLTVVSYERPGKNYSPYWKCICDCGNITVVRENHLIGGTTKSCGCLSRRTYKDNPNWKGYGEFPKKLFTSIKNSARKRDIPFDITIEDMWELYVAQNKKCKYTNIPLELRFTKDGKVIGTASLDRINSSEGYSKGNIQWVHKDINLMKWRFTHSQFIKYCELVIQNNK